ncbi:hypothetical protein GW17_00026458 [Ensete ventricosum]|nr:hypothetical protein GW17_00026458 [Ensete ventricosum]RZR97082.1 hypothetical protein BHM03_00026198 [Ensete ventricosum]
MLIWFEFWVLYLQTIEKLENMVDACNFYEAQQMYKSLSARCGYKLKNVSYELKHFFLNTFFGINTMILNHSKLMQVTCGAELAVLFVETLVKGKYSYNEETLGSVLFY